VASKRLNPRKDPVSFFSASYSTWEGAFLCSQQNARLDTVLRQATKALRNAPFLCASLQNTGTLFPWRGRLCESRQYWSAVRISVRKIEQMLQFDTKFILAAALVLLLSTATSCIIPCVTTTWTLVSVTRTLQSPVVTTCTTKLLGPFIVVPPRSTCL